MAYWKPDDFKAVLNDILTFTDAMAGLELRCYQEDVANAVIRSIIQKLGQSIVVVFPRQSGKNELQAQIESYLLMLESNRGGEIVKVSPTWKPQTQNAMRRLERILQDNSLTSSRFEKESGYIYRIGKARVIFLSGSPTTNVVGATASTLLQIDEAQDILPGKYDKDFAPMAASTNATRVFWGTMWTGQTLLARELRLAREAERADGQRRVFLLSADQVGAEVPAYRQFVAGQVARLGRQHPLVKTQYFSEEIDAQEGMFSPRRQALMRGQHPRQSAPTPGRCYALLIDVAGEDEGRSDLETGLEGLRNPQRDATALTVVEVDLGARFDPAIRAPVYRVVDRRLWTGVRHSQLYGQLLALAEGWGAQFVVVDATGVGAGLASFLSKALPGKVLPYQFNASTKSRLGWDFLAIIETGRFRDWADAADGRQDERWLFWREMEHCRMEVLPGPERRMRWGVPEGVHDPLTGDRVHDDLVISAALVTVIDQQDWVGGSATSVVLPPYDPLSELEW